MNSTPQVQTQEIADSELDAVAGGVAGLGSVNGTVNSLVGTADSLTGGTVSSTVATVNGTVTGAAGTDVLGTATGLTAGL
ncbi:type A2 lantipeptide [Streptomyces piniterrae]|uniref:Type A2 lantipeptide n=1 Tax=Streptomyces piniterrae TaxID=2571125 RepID=A0A4U0NW57_9ACTN|nr:type A2 lantipeptide [Streptomyces piniterrae]TJZ58949.1 type A2 lantipeptide [Streptomyces piniterrae]